MKIIDAFTYYNETDVLKLRLHELNDCVDYFVVVEGDETFTGQKKPLYFDDLPSWIDEFKDKIIRYTVTGFDINYSGWGRERQQRNGIFNAVSMIPGIDDEDVVFISDVDEIWNKSILKWSFSDPIRLNMTQYFWNINWRVPDHCNQGARPVRTKYKLMKEQTPQEMRASSAQLVGIPGWHFSFLNPLELGEDKIESFAHVEYSSDEFKSLEAMKHRIEFGIDPFDRFPLKYSAVDETYPQWIQQNPDAVSHLLYRGDALGEGIN